MNTSKLQKTISFPGLEPKESQIYLAALEIRQPTALKISKMTGIPRPTVHRLIDSLLQTGLIGEVIDGKRRLLIPEKPVAIVNRLKLQASAVQSILPELESLYSIYKNRPKIRMFNGREGMKRVCDDVLTTKAKELLSFSSVTNLFQELPDYFPAFVRRRVRKGMKARVLAPKNTKSIERKRLGTEQLRQVRFVPKSLVSDFDGLIFIYEDRIAYMSFRGDKNAVIIEHKELAEIQRASFEITWAISK